MLQRYTLLSFLLLEFKNFIRMVKINNWIGITNIFIILCKFKKWNTLTHIKYHVEIQKKAFSSTNILKNIYNLLCIMSLLCSFQDKIKMKVKHYIKYLQEKIFTRNIQWLLINDCMGKRITGFWFEQNVWQELDFNWCRYHFVKNLNTEGRKTEKN